MRNDGSYLFVWALAAAIALASGANVTSPLLAHLTDKLDAELRAVGIDTPRFDGNQLLQLQADAAAMRERFGQHYASDYLGDTSVELKINSPFPETASSIIYQRGPYRKRLVGDHFKWAKCEAIRGRRASFLQCNLLDAEVTVMKKVLVLMRISVDATRYVELEQIWRGMWSPDVETNVSRHEESFFLIRPISVSSEWRYLICPGDYTFCQVRVHLRQIASLDAFEAQLDFISGLMNDIEQEERRLLELSNRLDIANDICAKPTALGANATHVKSGSATSIGSLHMLWAILVFLMFLVIVMLIFFACFFRM